MISHKEMIGIIATEAVTGQEPLRGTNRQGAGAGYIRETLKRRDKKIPPVRPPPTKK